MTYAVYSEVPAYEQAAYVNGMPLKSEALIWAGKVAPPPIGAKIKVTMNGLGEAVVVGYFSEEGYLGLRTRLDNPPAWYIKQNKGNVIGHIFGPEFKVI